MSSIPLSFLEDVWIRKTLGLAGYSCLVYDHILTLDQEVEFIWRGPWTATKLIFLFNRYGNLFGQTYMQILDTGWVVNGQDSLQLCRAYNLFTVLFLNVSSESIHIIVLLRAWAIWGCRRRVAVWLIISYISYLLLTIIMTGIGANTATFQEFQDLGVIDICVGFVPRFIWFLPIASFVLDTLVFGTTMRSLRQHSRERSRLYPSPLYRRLFRDAILFYVMSTFFDAFMAICWTVYTTSPKYALSQTVSLNLLCITGQRLVLNLRGLNGRPCGTRSLSAEVDRQIGRINDASPDWWASHNRGKFHNGDEIPYEPGSLRRKTSVLMGGEHDVEMMAMDHRARCLRLGQLEAGATTDASSGDGGYLWTTSRTGREVSTVEGVSEVVREPDEAHTR